MTAFPNYQDPCDCKHATMPTNFSPAELPKQYDHAAAQKRWYRVYLPIRDHSRTFDITN